MWKSDKASRSPVPDPQENSSEGTATTYDDSTDMGVFARRETPTTLDELRGQGGFGVLVAASDMKQPASGGVPNIGSRFTSELDSISRRERQVREIQELATHRVIDLTADQLRRILEFMV